MSTDTRITYRCEICGKKTDYESNSRIVKSLDEGTVWRRIHVVINYVHGLHNDATTEQADLCKVCAVKLLQYAIKALNKGLDENCEMKGAINE